jgi:hypothetical protein
MMAEKKTGRRDQPGATAPEITPHFTLERIQLVHCDADLSLTGEHGPLHIEIALFCNAQSQGGNDPRIVATLEFSLTAIDQKDAPKTKPLIAITGKYGLNYRSDSPSRLYPDRLKRFIQSTAIPDAWPYWCTFVQSMAMRMGLPPIPVPLSAQSQLRKEPLPNQAKQTKRKETIARKAAGKKKPSTAARRNGS